MINKSPVWTNFDQIIGLINFQLSGYPVSGKSVSGTPLSVWLISDKIISMNKFLSNHRYDKNPMRYMVKFWSNHQYDQILINHWDDQTLIESSVCSNSDLIISLYGQIISMYDQLLIKPSVWPTFDQTISMIKIWHNRVKSNLIQPKFGDQVLSEINQ